MKQRRKYTVSQAKNLMHRAIEEIIDPGPRNIDSLWEHFRARCAYCGTQLDRDNRQGHADHAVSGGGNHLGNLVLVCGSCNGDEKREEEWREFLRRKTVGNPALFAEREQVILGWFRLWPRTVSREAPEVVSVRKDLEALIEQFGKKCAELRTTVNATNQ